MDVVPCTPTSLITDEHLSSGRPRSTATNVTAEADPSTADLGTQMLQGQIFYLKEYISGEQMAKHNIHLDALGHPVLILQLNISRKFARICTVSSRSKQIQSRNPC